MEQKKLFKEILIVAVILLSVLPVIVTFSAVLTKVFVKMQWYTILQTKVAPVEARLVAVLVKPIGITAKVTPNEADYSLVLIKKEGILPIRLEWNCLGWQSMILLLITMITGLKRKYSFLSKSETLLIGIIGTFLVNLFRMAFIVALAYYWNSFAALIMHDYLASFVALVWMIFFWWFCYSFVLEEKRVH